jgi:hypothetical protein
MGPVDRVAGLEPDHAGPAPLGEGGPGLGWGQGPGPHRPGQGLDHGLDRPGHRPGRRAEHPGHPRMVGVGGAIDQLGLGLAVAFEHLGDLQHPQQPAGRITQPQAAVVDPDPLGNTQTDRDRPQGAVGQPHRLGDRLVLLGPHEAGQRAVGPGGQGPQIGHLLGLQTPIHQLPPVRQAATRSGQPLLADRHSRCSYSWSRRSDIHPSPTGTQLQLHRPLHRKRGRLNKPSPAFGLPTVDDPSPRRLLQRP